LIIYLLSWSIVHLYFINNIVICHLSVYILGNIGLKLG